MLDLKFIRENLEIVQKGVASKKAMVDWDKVLLLDQERRELIVRGDGLRARQNTANEEISVCLKEKKDPKDKIVAMKKISGQIGEIDPNIRRIEEELQMILSTIPNLPHESVPLGGEDKNEILRQWGEPVKPDFQPRTHVEIAETLDIIDFKRAAKISGANFILFKKDGARLERALINFMLDLHTREHGYQEISPPFLVNRQAMTGTGQLPKMAEDMYHLKEDDLWLIPTAEVPITNIHRQEILREEDLPLCYVGYTPCFRREAGSYGKDTRGMARVHQFDKVEMVKFTRPENSYDELEKLLANAEAVLQRLNLPYRIKNLASEDLSFAAAKCYDIEVWAAGSEAWLEVSSCSNFEDFQARRADIRFKSKDRPKPIFVHTLNGSGLALARTVVALLENGQTKEGDVMIPKSLRPYMAGQDKITRS